MIRQRYNRREQVLGAIRQALILTIILLSLAACKDQSAAALSSSKSAAVSPPVTGVAQNSYADVVSRVAPAVVTIHSQMRVRAPQQFPFSDDPFFQQFFGDRGQTPQMPREQRATALGSGVIVSADGYILTNHHVVDGAVQIKVDLNDNRTLDAKVIGTDPPSDLAVLKVEASNLPVLQLGNSDNVRVGDVVLAIGNPLNVGQTVTMGIISAKGRQTGLSSGSFEDFLQTDAPINQGNSGGALVNTNGELVGINSQILSGTGGSIGIGFAIPSNMARSVMDQLIKTGKVRRGQLGIVVQKVTTDLAASLGMQEARGVIISQVQPDSAAERAGLKRGDVITALNGTAINDPNPFRNQVASAQPGTEITLTVVRQGKEQQVKATLGEFTPEKTASLNGEDGGANNTETGKLGISVEPLTPELAAQLQLKSGTQGVVVAGVDPSGPAADAGIQQGDVIEQVNQQAVQSAADVKAALARTGARPALLLVNRRGTALFLTVRPRQ
ncbi:MAG TPA: DegQ family serine endoprotease [Pyrinomonadaceae bacterium]